MPRVIFWDVDTQYDFMKADGKLYVPQAEHIIPNLKRLSDYAHGHGLRIVASADDHVVTDAEISEQPDWKTTFPAHCLRGTPGQKKIPETALRDPLVIEPARSDSTTLADRLRGHTGDLLFLKHRFDVFTNENVTTVLNLLDPEDIVLYGVATDVCDKAAGDDRATLGRDGAAARRARAAARPAVPHSPYRPRRYDVRDRVHGACGAQRRAPARALARQRVVQRTVRETGRRLRQGVHPARRAARLRRRARHAARRAASHPGGRGDPRPFRDIDGRAAGRRGPGRRGPRV